MVYFENGSANWVEDRSHDVGWANLHPPDENNNTDCCQAMSPRDPTHQIVKNARFACTRSAGHVGRHVAHGMGHEVMAIWED